MIQQKLNTEVARAKELSKATGANVLVMVYPSEESFLMSFEGQTQTTHPMALEKWNEDVVVGLRGPLEDNHLDLLVETIGMAIQNWKPSLKAVPELQYEA